MRVDLDEKLEAKLVELARRSVYGIADDVYTKAQKKAWIPEDVTIEFFAFEQTYVYLEDDEIVGFIDVKENGYVNYLYVLPSHQHKGIASALYEYVETRVLSLRVPVFYTHASVVAKPFFEKQGFKVTSEELVERGSEKLRYFVMTKRLDYE